MTRTTATLGFHHITMVAADARRTLAFYHELLGFPLVARTDSTQSPVAGGELWFGNDGGAPGTLVHVIQAPTLGRGRAGTGGVHHLALGTADQQTLLMWKRWLTDHGVGVAGPLNRGYFTSLYFKDPDGQVLEIATAGPGYATDEPIDGLGLGVMTQPDAQLPGYRDEAAIRALTHPEPIATITPAMTLQGIHHISGMTDDIGRAHEFYEAALGLRIIKKTINQDDPETPHWFWANYDRTRVAPHSSWTLFGWTPRHLKAREGTGQVQSVAFRATNADQLLAFQDHLRGMGVDVSDVIDHRTHSSITFRAPDGQALEIATDGPGFAAEEVLLTAAPTSQEHAQ